MKGRLRHRCRSLLVLVISSMLGLAVMEAGLRLYGLTDPLLYRSDPVLGYEPVRAQRIEQRGIVQVFDDRGFRVPAGESGQEVFRRIVVLGDSVTYGGTYIRTEDTFVERMNPELMTRGWRAFNAGVNAYSIAQMANRYMRSLHHPSDALVLLVFIPGDWDRAPVKFLHGTGPFYLQKPSCALWEALNLVLLMRFGVLIRSAGFRIPAGPDGGVNQIGCVADHTEPHYFAQNRMALEELARFCRSRGIPIRAIHSPGRAGSLVPTRVRDALAGAGVDLIDLATSRPLDDRDSSSTVASVFRTKDSRPRAGFAV